MTDLSGYVSTLMKREKEMEDNRTGFRMSTIGHSKIHDNIPHNIKVFPEKPVEIIYIHIIPESTGSNFYKISIDPIYDVTKIYLIAWFIRNDEGWSTDANQTVRISIRSHNYTVPRTHSNLYTNDEHFLHIAGDPNSLPEYYYESFGQHRLMRKWKEGDGVLKDMSISVRDANGENTVFDALKLWIKVCKLNW